MAKGVGSGNESTGMLMNQLASPSLRRWTEASTLDLLPRVCQKYGDDNRQLMMAGMNEGRPYLLSPKLVQSAAGVLKL